LGRERSVQYFADDDYEDSIIFTKGQRQDLCRLFNVIPADNPARGTVLNAIKEVLDKNDEAGLFVWYNSKYSEREVSKYAAKLLKEKFNHEV